eukprot:12891748-Prorocentrum_lima.AAC.1
MDCMHPTQLKRQDHVARNLFEKPDGKPNNTTMVDSGRSRWTEHVDLKGRSYPMVCAICN